MGNSRLKTISPSHIYAAPNRRQTKPAGEDDALLSIQEEMKTLQRQVEKPVEPGNVNLEEDTLYLPQEPPAGTPKYSFRTLRTNNFSRAHVLYPSINMGNKRQKAISPSHIYPPKRRQTKPAGEDDELLSILLEMKTLQRQVENPVEPFNDSTINTFRLEPGNVNLKEDTLYLPPSTLEPPAGTPKYIPTPRRPYHALPFNFQRVQTPQKWTKKLPHPRPSVESFPAGQRAHKTTQT